MKLKNIGLVLVAAVLMGLSVCYEWLWFLSFVGIIPFVYVIIKNPNENVGKAFWSNVGYGFLYGVVFFGICCVWLKIFGIPAWFGVTVFQGFYIAVFAGLSVFFVRNFYCALLGLPALWVAVDYIREQGDYGFSWYSIAHLQSYNLSLIQYASIFGARIIDYFILVLAAAFVLKLIDKNKIHQLYAVFAVIFICIVQLCGTLFIKDLGETDKRVGIIQGNMSMVGKTDYDALRLYEDLSLQVKKCDLILWPETTLSYLDDNDLIKRRLLSDLAKNTKSNLIIGSNTPSEKSINSSRNTALLISRQGDFLSKYSKIKLVPYGEFVPLRGKLPVFSDKKVSDTDTEKGDTRNKLKTEDMSIGVNICYESAFGDYLRRLTKSGANILVVITNDWWFGDSFAPRNHFMMSRLRAVENSRWVLRCASSGVSGVISPYGHIIEKSDLNKQAVLESDFGLVTQKTFYTKYGDVFSYLCLLYVLYVVIKSIVNKIINKSEKSTEK